MVPALDPFLKFSKASPGLQVFDVLVKVSLTDDSSGMNSEVLKQHYTLALPGF